MKLDINLNHDAYTLHGVYDISEERVETLVNLLVKKKKNEPLTIKSKMIEYIIEISDNITEIIFLLTCVVSFNE